MTKSSRERRNKTNFLVRKFIRLGSLFRPEEVTRLHISPGNGPSCCKVVPISGQSPISGAKERHLLGGSQVRSPFASFRPVELLQIRLADRQLLQGGDSSFGGDSSHRGSVARAVFVNMSGRDVLATAPLQCTAGALHQCSALHHCITAVTTKWWCH